MRTSSGSRSEAPLKQIAINAGLEGGVVAEKVRDLEAGHGLNAATGEYVDMIAAGIIDPAKVTRSALQNAASIAALFLTTEAVVADKPEKAPAMAWRPATAAWAAWTSDPRCTQHHTAPRTDRRVPAPTGALLAYSGWGISGRRAGGTARSSAGRPAGWS